MEMETRDLATPERKATMSDSSSSDSDALQHWNSLMARVAEHRDRQAFQQLFQHFAPLIKAFAYRVSIAEQGELFADELVQETMLKVWMKSQSFDQRLASASTWIFTVARNTRIDLLRKYRRQHSQVVSTEEVPMETLDTWDLWTEEQDSDLFNQLNQQRSRRQIQSSLRTLPQDQARVLEKVYLEDKSHSEVALELGLPLGTVKSRVRLALQKLKLSIDR